jgi:flagellar biosynthetic protein FlhB
MAEDQNGQDRTESATPKRREKARQDGNVARSVEVASVIVLVAGMVGLAATGERMIEGTAGLLRQATGGMSTVLLDAESVAPYLTGIAWTVAGLLLPFAGIVAVAGVGAHLSQVGVLITMKPLAPKLNRISPKTGIQRILSKRGAVELVKSVMKLIIVGAILGWSAYGAAEQLIPLMTAGLMSAYQAILAAMFRMVATAAMVLTVLAVLDFFFQRWDHEQQIKMTRQEVRDEMKQSEGDPMMKSKVRSRQQDLSRKRQMQAVKTADVVVTNPIHYAVALKYDSARMAAPQVVAKGARLLAKRIRDIARESGVPVVENPPLARALYRACKVGADVPLSLYKAVAEVLAFVFRKRDRTAAGVAR